MKNIAKPSILLVDDDHDIAWGIGRCLTRSGFSVVTCADGEEAISLLESKPFDVVITDIKMPKINGLALIDWIRKKKPRIRVIVMTAFGSPSMKDLTLGKGAMLYFEKPLDPDLLIDVLSAPEKSAFCGSIAEIDILDYLQLIMLTGKKLVLEVSSTTGVQGSVFIDNGEIRHAVCADLIGEEALYRCLSFRGGTFSNLPWRDPDQVTINKPGEFVLFEAARKRDDAKAVDMET